MRGGELFQDAGRIQGTMKPRKLSVVLVLLALLLTAPAAQATRTSPHLGALTAAELPPPLPSRSVLAAGPPPALPLLSPKDRAISAALASLDEPERARLLGLRRFRLTAAAAPLSRLEPPVRGQKTASGRFFAPGAPNLWETRLFSPASRQGDLFLEPDPLGPVDSPNLYQAFGFDGLNVRDPWGLQTPSAAGLADKLDKVLDRTTGVLCHGDPMCLAVNNQANGFLKGSYDFLRFGDKIPEQLEAARSGDWTRARKLSQLETLRAGQLGLTLAPIAIRGQSLFGNVEGRALRFEPSPRGGVEGPSTAAIENGARGGPGTEGPASLPLGRYQRVPALAQGDQIPLSSVDVYQARSGAGVTQSVLDRIDPTRFSPDTRFGRAFYVAERGETAIAEVAFHGGEPTHVIRYTLHLSEAKVLDLTDPLVAQTWGNAGAGNYAYTQAIAERARAAGYQIIKYPSLRGPGENYAILDNFDTLLQPQGVSPAR